MPHATRLSVIIKDPDGRPLADVWMDHTGRQGETKTSTEGRFEIETRAPAIVFRKSGFQSKYFRIERDATIEAKLGPAVPLKACRAFASCLSLKGFMSEFCLPRVKGFRVTPQKNDIDYGQRLFIIQTQDGSERILEHAAGALWAGSPPDEDVWSAVEYQELNYRDLEGSIVIDARGRTSNGQHWRVLGHAFESASYRRVSSEEARLLDEVLDSVCLRSQPRK